MRNQKSCSCVLPSEVTTPGPAPINPRVARNPVTTASFAGYPSPRISAVWPCMWYIVHD